MALEICRHCFGDSLSCKQLNRGSKASLSPPYLAQERGSCRNKHARKQPKKGDRDSQELQEKGANFKTQSPKGPESVGNCVLLDVQYPEGLLRESMNNSSTTCQVYCSAGILCLLGPLGGTA